MTDWLSTSHVTEVVEHIPWCFTAQSTAAPLLPQYSERLLFVCMNVYSIYCSHMSLSSQLASVNNIVAIRFLPCDAMLARYMLSSSVCLPVRPSVCHKPPEAGTAPKQLNAGSCKQRRTIDQGF